MEKDKQRLVLYEMPRFAMYISNDFLQNLIARYVARKVNRKLKRLAEYDALSARVRSLTQ